MEGDSRSRRTLRRAGVTVVALALVFILLSGSVVASDEALVKDDFKGDDGDLPKKDRWAIEDDGGTVQIIDNNLDVDGTAYVETKDPFSTFQFTVDFHVSPLSMEGKPIDFSIVSEEHDEEGETKEAAFVGVSYDNTTGWTLSWKNKKVIDSHSDNVKAELNEWYRVVLVIDQEEASVNVTRTVDGEEVWAYEQEVPGFYGENFMSLGSEGGHARYNELRVYDDMYHWQEHKQTSVTIVMFVIFFIVLFLPFIYRPVEHNLEAFLFTMGFLAVSMNSIFLDKSKIIILEGGDAHSLPPFWTGHLVWAALEDPLMITAAVLIAGMAFHYGRDYFKKYMEKAINKMQMGVFVFIIIVTLGMVASMITAIISALLLVEVITVLRLDRKTETELTIIACFSIGLGAALTPLGEPLSTIVIVTKLQEDFWYLLVNIGKYVIPAVFAFGIIGYFYATRSHVSRNTLSEDQVEEEQKEVFIRTGKVYLFVMALVLLGTGFAPLIEWYIIKLPPMALYWVNTSSAILDNATLAAAEITRSMSQEQINAALMSLLISGGMLIPGNIPNIISASKLHITSKEWATFGVPIGMVWLAIFFVILFVITMF
jgi:predicted cation transporter